MGLRCLLGHDFGPSGVVREHEEDGNEMVVTEREIRRCKRCGDEQVLAESTEIRAIRSEADVERDRSAADAASQRVLSPGEGSAASPETASELDASAESTSETDALRAAAESVTGADDGRSASTGEESTTSLIERAEEGFADSVAPGDEDAVVLDETDETAEREHGAWPDSEGVGDPTAQDGPVPTGADHDDSADASGDVEHARPDASDASAAPEPADETRSLAETAAEEDAELLDGTADETESAADETEPTASTDAPETDATDTADDSGSWPAHDDSDDEGFAAQRATSGGPEVAYGNELTPSTNGESYDTAYLDNTVEDRDGDGTIVSAGSEVGDVRRAGVETEYYCPNCDHTRSLDSSLRSGDICPSCHSGYIAERER